MLTSNVHQKKVIQRNLREMIDSSIVQSKNHQEKNQRRARTSSTYQTQFEDQSLRKRQNAQLLKSCSKHSLKSKPKINTKIKTQLVHVVYDQNYDPRIQNKFEDQINKIDAVFTDLEDYFYHFKEKIISKLSKKIEFNQSASKNNLQVKQFVQQLTYMSEQIKARVQSLQIQNLKPNQEVSEPLGQISITNRLNCLKNLSSFNQKKSKYQSRGQIFKNKKQSIYQMVLSENKIKFQMLRKK